MVPQTPEGTTSRQSRPSPSRGRGPVLVLAAVFIVAQVAACVGLMPGTFELIRRLRRQPPETRQIALLSSVSPLAAQLDDLSRRLPLDATVFMVNAPLEDYYLANYLLCPRRVLVDMPDVPINGLPGQLVGTVLSGDRLRDLGVTCVIIVDSSGTSMRVVPLGGTQP
jgi:hypothetical protein